MLSFAGLAGVRMSTIEMNVSDHADQVSDQGTSHNDMPVWLEDMAGIPEIARDIH